MYVFASEGKGLLYKNKIICNSLCVCSCMCVCEVMHMRACAGQRPMIVLLPYHCPLWACMYVYKYVYVYVYMYVFT